jgi:tetratricopeptide (TPR) repeat protein/transglutaminase-like putative cysteine protease
MVFLLILALPRSVGSQTAPSAPDSKPDYSQESYVIERLSQKVEFQNDGTSSSQTTLRAKVQSDAGVKQLGLLVFQYLQANETLEIPSVHVLKPDGSTVTTPAGNIQDLPADVTREAPFYSDVRQKHVAVRGLSAGDTLEYQVRSRTHTPLVPGQFWLVDDFTRNAIVLEETLEVSVPGERAVRTKFGDLKPTLTEEGSRRIYRWKTSNLKRKSEEELKAETDEPPSPAVQFTTFQSFEEVGQWYGRLQRERVEPTPEIRAKAAELTKGATTDDEKLKAIYNYVSLNFRYIGIAFGMGRYQPNPAADVLANQYGDCKDKHTLLASLLKAAGLTAYPALINASRKTDTDMPSPAQFDHVITAIPQGDKYLWLDTTPEVAPFGFLFFNLRDKQALVIPEGRTPVLAQTPKEPPSPGSMSFKVEGALNDSGTLEARIDRSLRGDVEVIFRAAFRRTPQPQWKDVVQNISYASGFSGTVSNIEVSAPEATDAPFRFSYDYSRKEYPDWANHRVTMPCPPYGLPQLKDQEDEKRNKLNLGFPVAVVYEGKVGLPKDYTPELPAAVDLKEDFAEYHATYAFKDGVLSSERRLTIKEKEIPKERFEAYRKFVKAANDDEGRYISLKSAAEVAAGEKRNPEADRLFEEGRQALQRMEIRMALDLFKKVLEVDPKYKGAWGTIGFLQFQMQQIEEGLRSLRKEIEVHPEEVRSYKALGFALMAMSRHEEAVRVWQDLRAVAPEDRDAPANLGIALMYLRKYKEATPVLESAGDLNEKSASIKLQLGSCYLETGDTEKAWAAYQKAAELDPTPITWNHIAYSLADKGQKLPEAVLYAEMAAKEQEKRTQEIQLDKLDLNDLKATTLLSMIWDTLGWAYFRVGDLDDAETYLAAAWGLQQDSTHADHLGQIYERQGKKQAAIHAYAWALAVGGRGVRLAPRPGGQRSMNPIVPDMQDTRNRLFNLVRSNARVDALVRDAGGELSQMRTVKLKTIVPKLVTAEFFVLLSPGPTVEEVKFISGAEELRVATKALSSAKFDVLFPDDRKSKILRRGILMCHPGTAGCEFVLYPPDSVQSLN